MKNKIILYYNIARRLLRGGRCFFFCPYDCIHLYDCAHGELTAFVVQFLIDMSLVPSPRCQPGLWGSTWKYYDQFISRSTARVCRERNDLRFQLHPSSAITNTCYIYRYNIAHLTPAFSAAGQQCTRFPRGSCDIICCVLSAANREDFIYYYRTRIKRRESFFFKPTRRPYTDDGDGTD